MPRQQRVPAVAATSSAVRAPGASAASRPCLRCFRHRVSSSHLRGGALCATRRCCVARCAVAFRAAAGNISTVVEWNGEALMKLDQLRMDWWVIDDWWMLLVKIQPVLASSSKSWCLGLRAWHEGMILSMAIFAGPVPGISPSVFAPASPGS